MLIRASVKSIRISAEKMRLVVDQIKKMTPPKAVQILTFVNKSSSPVLKKLIASALANAKNNYGIDEKDLIFKEILIGNGPMFKRYQPVSRGRAHHILKRTCNIKIVLESKAGQAKALKAPQTKEVSKELKIKENQKLPKSKGEKRGTKS